jgi:hypothetical protein
VDFRIKTWILFNDTDFLTINKSIGFDVDGEKKLLKSVMSENYFFLKFSNSKVLNLICIAFNSAPKSTVKYFLKETIYA